MGITIRIATAADAEIVHGFIVALAEYEREPDAVEVTPELLRAQLEETPPPFECLLAQDAATLEQVGFALFFHTYSTWRGRPCLYLEDLFVPPARRGRGIGRALLARLAAVAVARDCPRLEWAVLRWNELAIGFYRELGGEALEEWVTYRLSGEPLARLAQEGDLGQ